MLFDERPDAILQVQLLPAHLDRDRHAGPRRTSARRLVRTIIFSDPLPIIARLVNGL